ncbi:PREDICTED: neuromedin-S isoform X2 [Hipposideros armiger]|uniref:Neuromedin-S isoform X2 n=1 Tax=Hipposideros armiger TaxID=186990 RepID=A0A8B7T8K3_HIPAR|nr:PREDICTED: neuromedin-S isoform X2 [Hipposideros armiger]
MRRLPQFPSILAIYCFCLLQIPSSGFPRPLADSPDGLDIVQHEWLANWATLSRQPKDKQDIYKRFLFHYSRTQEPTFPVKIGDSGVAAEDFTKKDHAATWGRPFFLFRVSHVPSSLFLTLISSCHPNYGVSAE